jgi:hypothetical protein
MKRLIMLLVIVLMISGCEKEPNEYRNLLNKDYDETGFKWLVQDEVISQNKYGFNEGIIAFNSIYGKEYRIIGVDANNVLVVEKRDRNK